MPSPFIQIHTSLVKAKSVEDYIGRPAQYNCQCLMLTWVFYSQKLVSSIARNNIDGHYIDGGTSMKYIRSWENECNRELKGGAGTYECSRCTWCSTQSHQDNFARWRERYNLHCLSMYRGSHLREDSIVKICFVFKTNLSTEAG